MKEKKKEHETKRFYPNIFMRYYVSFICTVNLMVLLNL